MVSSFRVLFSVLLLAAACTDIPAGKDVPTNASPQPVSGRQARTYLEKVACANPRRELLRTWRGYYPGRSGEIQLVTDAPHVIGNWKPHSGPWEHVQRVPLFWYGPGHVPATGRVDRHATMADVAPTMAALVGHGFDTPDGRPLEEVLPSKPGAVKPPRLVVVMVWDGGGLNVLDEHPKTWPELRRLIPEGVWYERAEAGSSPSITPAIHANIGTGTFPRTHGVVDARVRLGDDLARPEFAWPRVLRVPALADVYDRDFANEPKVGVVATLTWHLTMIGKGAAFPDGDRDVIVLAEGGGWGDAGNSRFYRFPSYVENVPRPDESRLDREDGKLDGAWYGLEIGVEDPKTRARSTHAEWQTRIIETIIRREGFGADEIPDLLFTNFKEIDHVSHGPGLNSLEMAAAVRSADVALQELVAVLNRQVGRGRWVLVLTADHGVTPDPAESGGLGILPGTIRHDLEAAFDDDGGHDVIEAIRPTEIWVDVKELRDNGFTLNDMARFLSTYTRKQVVSQPASLSQEQRKERIFSMAIPGPMLERLPCLAPDAS